MGLAFFILAYVELFTGVAKLPGGPITEFTGAMQTVWNPQWKLIGAFAIHGLLLGWLMSMALIAMDRQNIPRKLIVVGILLSLLALWVEVAA